MKNTKSFGPPAPNGEPAARLGVLLVDPLQIVCEGIGLLIDTQPDLEVVARAGSADDALEELQRVRGKGHLVALVALELDGEHDAFWLIQEVRRLHPSIRIAALGNVPDRMAISRALFVGADGYIDRRANPVQFLDAVRHTLRGEMMLVGVPHDWLGPIAGDVERGQEPRFILTDRERQVLSVAAEGLTAKGIADRLGVSERTVTTHLARIYEKLGVNNRVSAVTAAARSGLVVVEGMDSSDREVS
jgi:DNA-binding NarL/FixJ family response regulator